MCVCCGWCREGEDGREGVVLLQPSGQEVPDGAEDEQGDGGRVLEGHRQGQRDLQLQDLLAPWDEEDARLLQRQSPQRREDQLGYA